MLLGVKARQIRCISIGSASLLDGSYRVCRSGALGYALSLGFGMLQNAFNPAGSGWVHHHACLIQRDEPRLAGEY
jgi:hypothetical protein